MSNGAAGGSQPGDEVVKRYDPPGYMTDFDRVPGLRNQWSNAVSGWFDEVIEGEEEKLKPTGQRCQYYNQLKHETKPPLEQSIVWNAFSGTLLRRYGYAEALEVGEKMLPLSERQDGQGSYYEGAIWSKLFYRPHDEYCEWRAERDEDGKITRVTFTSEPPEYWQALRGDELPDLEGNPKYPIVGDPQLLLDLYREYVNPEVELDDLLCAEDLVNESGPEPAVVYRKGGYNPYNKWNTTHGIMHLTQPANSLQAEIQLGGDATILRERFGRRITDPDALICGAGYGGANRCSDPTIGASVNELAALGCWITLRNPVGLYMDHLETAGWSKPDGSPIEPEYFQILRGKEGLIERAVFEVPPSEGFKVGDIRIGGVPIAYGGQMAQYMTVRLIGVAAEPGTFQPRPLPCDRSARIDPANPEYLIQSRPKPDPESKEITAFDYPDVSS